MNVSLFVRKPPVSLRRTRDFDEREWLGGEAWVVLPGAPRAPMPECPTARHEEPALDWIPL